MKVGVSTVKCHRHRYGHCGPYYKSKLELKSNSIDILAVNCKFICDSAAV